MSKEKQSNSNKLSQSRIIRLKQEIAALKPEEIWEIWEFIDDLLLQAYVTNMYVSNYKRRVAN